MYDSICLLPWCWYDDENACSMFRFLQKAMNLSETKLLPESTIIFFGSLYSAKITLHISIRLSAENPLFS